MTGAARKIRNLAAYGPGELALMPLALCLLGAVRLIQLALPVRRYLGILGERAAGDSPVPPATPRQIARARSIAQAVGAAARVVPWRSDCLPQALAGAVLLRLAQVPHLTRFGVGRGTPGATLDALTAHAWTLVGGTAILGGRAARGLRPVASFIHR